MLPIFRAVAEGRLTQAEALVRIKALKRQSRDPGQGVLLADVEWTAAPARASAEQAPDRVLLWGVSRDAVAALQAQGGPEIVELSTPVSGSVDDVFAQATLQAFEAIRSMLGATAGARVLLVVADAAEATVAAGFEAMCRTAMEENPGFAVRTVRVPADIDGDELRGVVRDESSMASPRGVAVRHVRREGGLHRQIARWRVVDMLENGSAGAAGDALSVAPVVFKEGGCYLITGGAGGIGLQFAREIVTQTGAARIVLTGRSPLGADARRAIDSLSTPSHRIDYVELDATRAEAVDALIARLQAEGTPPRGILHCAGILRDAFAIRKSTEDFAAVLAPKVAGLVNLDRATRDLPLDFLLLCSSFAACWGIVGQIDYAAANAFMDAFAAHRNRLAARGERCGRTLSVNWPLWRDGGMTIDAATWERLQDHTGMEPLATATAMRATYRGFALDCERLLVMEGELPSMQALLEVSDSTQEAAPVRTTPVDGDTAHVGMDDALRAKALDYLCQQCAQVLKVPVARLRPDAPLEQYGIDSILAMKLVTHLESIFGRLPKTLAFEYQTIAQLNGYFCETHAQRLIAILAPDRTTARPAAAQGPAPAPTPVASRIPGKRGAVREPARTEAAGMLAASSPADAKPVDTRPVESRAVSNEPIAIVGLSGRYPDAWDLDAYWHNLSQGVDCIREIPAERWRWQDFYREAAKGQALDPGQHSSKWGGFIEGADEFDPRFFSITPRDAEQIDPQERLFLQHAWMAIEDAGYTRAALQACRGGQVGVYAGVMYGEYNRSGSLASIANRVSYALNVHGPSMTLDTMCSSSLTAIHLACQDLRLGRTDMALAGGVNLSIHPGKYSMLSAGQFISSDGHCQSFGEGGDGYIPGEGVGVVVLKRLSDAERDGDAIHAIIRGSALNHGGKTNGYTVPNPQAQAAVIADALRDAGVDARQVSYIEAHGTGTKLGDPIEIAALSKAFREHTQDTGFCLIGSAKSNIGHCESAAGIAGLTKVVLQMRHRQIVPSLHSARLNPNIDFETTPFEVNQRLREWRAPVIDGREAPLIAGISSFGAGGGNAHLVVEAYAGNTARASREESIPCVVLLSARTLPQLRQKAEDLRAFVEREPDLDLHSLAYTLQIGREPMEERLGLRADTRAELLDKLALFLATDEHEDGALADDLYYAQSRRHRESMALFTVDRDLQASVDGWFVAGKVSRLLDVWTKGLDLDWLKLHGAPLPARMHLPVYPFARERYWREATAERPAAGGTEAAMHSLVHRNASKPGRQRYASSFRADDPRIAGLRVQGHAGLPLGLQIEAARAALADAMPQASGWALHDVRLAAPRAVDGLVELEIAVLPPGQGARPGLDRTAFELSDVGDGHVFSQGLLIACDDTSPPVIDIATATRGASSLHADRTAILDAHRAQGIEIDSLYQIATGVQRTAEGLWLDFAAAAPSPAFADCTIDPALVDAAMRAAPWLGSDRDALYLPAGFSAMHAYPVAARPRHASIRPHGAQQGDALCVDIDLCAEDGTVCVAFSAVTLLPTLVTAVPRDETAAVHRTPVALTSNSSDSVAEASPKHQAIPAPPMPERRFSSRIADMPAAVASAADNALQTSAALQKPAAIALVAPDRKTDLPASPTGKPSLSLAIRQDAVRKDLSNDLAGSVASVVLRDDGDGLFTLRLSAIDGRVDAPLIDALREALAFAGGLPVLKALLIESDADVFLHGDPRVLADEAGRALLQALSAFPAPTVALLSVSALGAGFRIACACDLVLAVEDQRYGFAVDATGTDTGTGTPGLDVDQAAWLVARFGEALALRLIADGGPLDGRALQAAGWGASVVEITAFADSVDGVRAALSDKSADALRLLKAHLAREFDAAVAALAAVDVAASGSDGTPSDALSARVRSIAQIATERAPMLSAHGWSSSPDAAVIEPGPTDAAATAVALPLSSAVVRASVDADGVVLVRLEDRDARNMFSDALIAGLQEVFDHIAQSPACKAVVLTGYDTYFSSGGTRDGLKAIQEGKVRFTDHDVFHLPMRCPVPVIAAMQGHGIGAGWTLGLFCDVVLFSAESRYLSPYMNFGFTPGAGATGILPARLGFDLARDSLFTGREITGEALARRNPLLSVLPREQVLDQALAIARGFARRSREDLQASKAAHVAPQLAAWQALFAREVEMHASTLVGQRDALARIEQRFASAQQADVDMPQAAEHRASAVAVPVAEVLSIIRRLLAEELRVEEGEIDPRTPFVDIGLDSISSVTWIRRINARFGLSIEATKVYSYPNLQKLAQHLAEQSSAGAEATSSAPPANLDAAATPVRAAATRPTTTAEPARSRVELGAVRRTLVELLAQELREEPESIDADRGFVDLGLDSISGVTWVRAINGIYGTEIEATRVYTYPTVELFARFVRDLLAQRDAQETSSEAPEAIASIASPRIAARPVETIVLHQDRPPLQSWRGDDAAMSAPITAQAQGRTLHAAEIAVIGMAGRFPMAKDLDAFWDNIANGRNCISEIPPSRWDAGTFYTEGQPGLGQTNSKWMGVLEGHDRFDPLFFGLSPVEAEAMDPQQRLFLECCWHGIESAGYTAERLSGSRCGVFVGCANGDYHLLSREQQVDALGFTGNATSILAARVSYFLNLQGPCVSIDTACSSSLVAISNACDSLITGASDMALAGGVYVMANADMFLKTAHAGMLSPDGRCYTFDQRANGFVPGEGVGVVMLKRLADAERDGDEILGVIRGWGVNQDGRTNGITAPNAESQQRLMRDVHTRFGIDPGNIQLIEAHGTGTKLGDPIEIDGLKSAFLPATDRRRFCAIGSVKTNIGHCLTAAGVSGFIKLLLSLRHRKLPPTINYETPNEHLALDDSPFFVNTTLREWVAPAGVPRQAAISSFGFSGTNAHLVLAEHVPQAATVAITASVPAPVPAVGVIVPLSARTADQLLQKAKDLRAWIQTAHASGNPLDLVALAGSLQLHRDAMDDRLCFVAHSIGDVVERLTAFIDGNGAQRALPHGAFAAHVRQGRESVRLLNEDATMAELVVDRCIADGNLARLCDLWVKGLALDWRKLHGERRLPLLPLPPYPFAEETYWIAPSDQDAFARPAARGDRPVHRHPLLQEKVADLREQGYRQTVAAQGAAAEDMPRTRRIHLPTYAFARMHCWIPSKAEAGGTPSGASSPSRGIDGHGGTQPDFDAIAALFAALEEDRLSTGEVAARVKQLA
ncbi:SDR family NAD(P)-dependent oxidoreductase [Lysobacter brunescens]|uniref:SDR family NAD(P)-dependent oxidoreductase n=1 Tax=Lysobacter brunescens TaxID=262323 RepID=UPI0036DB3262